MGVSKFPKREISKSSTEDNPISVYTYCGIRRVVPGNRLLCASCAKNGGVDSELSIQIERSAPEAAFFVSGGVV